MNIVRQGIFFCVISGIGWMLDFCMYFVLAEKCLLSVFYANLVSSLTASSFVFVFSTRKIFSTAVIRIPLRYKYVVYIAYQFILILGVSTLAEFLYAHWNVMEGFFSEYLKIWVKLFITPVTVVCNFVMMKILTEKV